MYEWPDRGSGDPDSSEDERRGNPAVQKEGGAERPRPKNRRAGARFYQFTRTPKRSTRGANTCWMLLALDAFWVPRMASTVE